MASAMVRVIVVAGSVAGRPGRRRRRSTIATESSAAEPVDEAAQRVLDGLEPALALHRSGRVDDEGQGGVVASAVAHVAGLEADPQEDLSSVA